MLSLRVSRDKRGYDYIYLLLEGRRRGRVENRLLYCGRWPAPCRVGIRPFDDEMRARLEEAYPDVAFDWPALLKTLQAALGMSRPAPAASAPPPPRSSRRPAPSSSPYGGRPSQPRRPAAVVLVSAEMEERETPYVAPEFEPVDETDRAYAADVELELVTDEIVQLPVPESEAAPAAPDDMTGGHGGHVFVEPSGAASFAPDAEADADSEANAGSDTDDGADADAGADAQADADLDRDGDLDPDGGLDADGGAQPAELAGSATAAPGAPGAQGTPGVPGDPNRPRRRRRRRGGRGRGKPPDVRQSSE